MRPSDETVTLSEMKARVGSAALVLLAAALSARAGNVRKPVSPGGTGIVLPVVELAPARFTLQRGALELNARALVPVAAIVPVSALVPASAVAPVVPAALEANAAVSPATAIVEALRPGARTTPEQASTSAFDGTTPKGSGAAPVVPPQARAPQIPGSEGLSGRALLAFLREWTGRGYRAKEYEEASDYMFSTADQRVVNGRAGVMDAYSGIFVEGRSRDGSDYPERGDQNRDGEVDRQGMNVEHLWPQSFFGKRLPMRSDLHALMATFIHPNGVRGALPFGVVRGQGDYSNSAGAKRGQGVFEPPDAAKGRVARAMLYFYTRYGDRNIYNGGYSEAFWNKNLDMFLDWNRRFPPDDWERARNGLVERFQGNRNPFVDDPALVERVGADDLRREKAAKVHKPKRFDDAYRARQKDERRERRRRRGR